MSGFQIKAMAFKVSKSLFNPHPFLRGFAGRLRALQIGGQQPRVFFTGFPVSSEVDPVRRLGRQKTIFQPLGLSSFLHQTIQALIVRLTVLAQQIAALLAQNIAPMPLFEQFLYVHFAKFSIFDQQHLAFSWYQGAHVAQ